MTKATGLKIIFLKSPWKMRLETCVTLWIFFFLYFVTFSPFIWHFFQHSPGPKLLKISVLFSFQWAYLEKWGYTLRNFKFSSNNISSNNIHFNPIRLVLNKQCFPKLNDKMVISSCLVSLVGPHRKNMYWRNWSKKIEPIHIFPVGPY